MVRLKPDRQRTRIIWVVATLLLLAIVVAALSLYYGPERTLTVTETSTTTASGAKATETSVQTETVTERFGGCASGMLCINSSVSHGLELSAMIDPAQSLLGDNISVIAWVANTLPTVVNATVMAMTNPVYGPCEQDFSTGVEVFQGYSTPQNLSRATVLQLYDPAGVYACPTAGFHSYSFSPDSDIAKIDGSVGQVSEVSVLSGYYANSGGVYSLVPFPPEHIP